MAPVVPSCEPVDAIAGDTWTWTHQNPDYPVADSWVLSYSIRGPSALTWDATWVANDGTKWTVTIPAASTAPLIAGVYIVERHYTLSAQRYTDRLPKLEVAVNAAAVTNGSLQSEAEIYVAALKAVLYPSGAAIPDVVQYVIHGRQLQKNPRAELLKELRQWEAVVRRERNGGRNPAIRIAFGRART
jgi:hypothetical protein